MYSFELHEKMIALFWVLYHLLLTVFRFWHGLSIVLSFSELWQVLPMSKYCIVFFLTGDRVWLELSFLLCSLTCATFCSPFLFSDCCQVALFDYCTVFFWLVTDFGTVGEFYLLFLTGDRFWPCLSIVPSFSDWWQVLALFEYCAIVCSVWELHHLFLTFDRFWPWLSILHLFLTGDRFWLYLSIVPFFRTVSRFWHCLRMVPSFLTGDRFWPCLSIVPSFSDFDRSCSVWVLYYLFLTVIRFWLCLSKVPSFLTFDRFWPCLSIVPSFPDFDSPLLCSSIVPSFSDCYQVLALFEYCTIFFWQVTGFGSVSVLYHLFLTVIRFWPCLSIIKSFSDR